jgi:hypothetical protein
MTTTFRTSCLRAKRRPSIRAWYSAKLWVPWSKRLTRSYSEPSLNLTMQAAVTGPGLWPPPSKWMVAFFTLGAFSPTA